MCISACQCPSLKLYMLLNIAWVPELERIWCSQLFDNMTAPQSKQQSCTTDPDTSIPLIAGALNCDKPPDRELEEEVIPQRAFYTILIWPQMLGISQHLLGYQDFSPLMSIKEFRICLDWINKHCSFCWFDCGCTSLCGSGCLCHSVHQVSFQIDLSHCAAELLS